MAGIQELGKSPKADLYASFDAIRLQLRQAANRDDSPEAKDAHKDISHFVAKLEENGLWDYLLKIRDEDKQNSAD